MKPALTLKDVTVSIGGKKIIESVSLELHPGEVTAIIGPNGAGKSTLLSAASGHLRPTTGLVLLGEKPTANYKPAHAARIRAVMAQESGVAFSFTVREVVAMGRTPWVKEKANDDAAINEALDLTDIQHLAERDVTTLSGGERQRTALARVIAQATPVNEASVVLLDEPTSAMDVAHAEATLRLARDLAARGAAVGVVLHDLDAAASYADRLVLMDRGQIRAVGSVREVATAELLSQVYNTEVEVFEFGGRLRVSPLRASHGQIA